MRKASSQDSRRLVPTGTPGIYTKGSRYVVVYRDSDGRQRKQSCSTKREADAFKATVTADKARGEIVRPSRVTVADYFAGWLPAYRGRTSKGDQGGHEGRLRRADAAARPPHAGPSPPRGPRPA